MSPARPDTLQLNCVGGYIDLDVNYLETKVK